MPVAKDMQQASGIQSRVNPLMNESWGIEVSKTLFTQKI